MLTRNDCSRGGASRKWKASLLFLFLLQVLGHGAKLAAQDEAKPTEGLFSKATIMINGYLTEAYAKSDGHQFLGITEKGTADYQTAALRVRADMTQDDSFVVQFAHIRIGNSNIQQLKSDVDVEWLYYQHNFGDSSIKVGRVQIPFGIYNEVRDVGTVLPFYRPPHNFYGDAAFGSETLEGVVLTHRLKLGAGWSLTGDLHYGNWKFGQSDFRGGYFFNRVDRSKGVELWVETPVEGLRIGGGVMRYNLTTGNPAIPVLGSNTWQTSHLSLEGQFDRFNIHSEWKDIVLGPGLRGQTGWAQAGVRLYRDLTLNAQRDLLYIKNAHQPRTRFDDDRALGLDYAIRPTLVLKAEHHWNEGSFWVEDVPAFFGGPTPKTRYWLLSVSTAF